MDNQEARNQVEQFRNAIIALAIAQKLDFNVLFTAMSQLTVTWIFEYLLLTEGELTEFAVDAALAKFGLQTADVALNSINALKSAEQSQIITEA